MKPQSKFEFFICAHEPDYFEKCARMATRLKPFGRVRVSISDLAEKSAYEMPEGGSGWHDYTSYIGPVHKFFPHPDIARHLPEEHIAKNRELLLAKAAILNELGLDALFYGQEPYFLPESFFLEFPDLRGARVDHPPRSREAAFSMCMDQARSLEMMEWMLSELRSHVPHLEAYVFNTNDAGAGFCWSDYNYAGSNGPRHCQTRNAGERMKGLLEAIHKGAEKKGGPIEVRMRHNISRFECDTLLPILPANSVIQGKGRSERGFATTGSLLSESDPVFGFINPLGIINVMEQVSRGNVHTVLLNFSSHYQRVAEPIEVIEHVLNIAVECLEKPTKGQISRLEKLNALCRQWTGEDDAEKLFEAFCNLHRAMENKSLACGGHSGLYEGVSTRHITRPLVIRPEQLNPDEEDYFLPYVFDTPKGLGRDDYLMVHSGSRSAHWDSDWFWNQPLQSVLGTLKGCAGIFEQYSEAPGGAWLTQLACSVKMYSSVLRTIDNFFFAQVFRTRHKDLLQDPVELAQGHAREFSDHLQWNEIMRDEVDNVGELITMLEEGGLEYFAHASQPEAEDTFLLGPAIVDDLRKKLKITLAHWRDLENYIAPLSK